MAIANVLHGIGGECPYGVDGAGIEIGPPVREDCAGEVCVSHTHLGKILPRRLFGGCWLSRPGQCEPIGGCAARDIGAARDWGGHSNSVRPKSGSGVAICENSTW